MDEMQASTMSFSGDWESFSVYIRCVYIHIYVYYICTCSVRGKPLLVLGCRAALAPSLLQYLQSEASETKPKSEDPIFLETQAFVFQLP